MCIWERVYLGDELLEHLRIEGHLLELEGEGGVRLVRVRVGVRVGVGVGVRVGVRARVREGEG